MLLFSNCFESNAKENNEFADTTDPYLFDVKLFDGDFVRLLLDIETLEDSSCTVFKESLLFASSSGFIK